MKAWRARRPMGDGSDSWDVVIVQGENRIDVACMDEAGATSLIEALDTYSIDAQINGDETAPY